LTEGVKLSLVPLSSKRGSNFFIRLWVAVIGVVSMTAKDVLICMVEICRKLLHK